MKATNLLIVLFILKSTYSLAKVEYVDCNIGNLVKPSLTRIEKSQARTYIAVRHRDLLNEYYLGDSSLYTQALAEYIKFPGSNQDLKHYFHCQSLRYKDATEVAREVVSNMTD